MRSSKHRSISLSNDLDATTGLFSSKNFFKNALTSRLLVKSLNGSKLNLTWTFIEGFRRSLCSRENDDASKTSVTGCPTGANRL